MYDYHAVAAAVGILFGFVGLFLYVRSILRGETRPHIFTWLSFALIDIVIFLVQITEGGGFGAWVTFASVVGIVTIVALSLRYGEKDITTSDWLSFVAALLGILMWRVTSEPLTAVVILTATNFLSVVPTFRKSYSKPLEESIGLWSLDIAKFALGIVALSSITLTTALFPLGIVATNAALVMMILYRRYALDGHSGVL